MLFIPVGKQLNISNQQHHPTFIPSYTITIHMWSQFLSHIQYRRARTTRGEVETRRQWWWRADGGTYRQIDLTNKADKKVEKNVVWLKKLYSRCVFIALSHSPKCTAGVVYDQGQRRRVLPYWSMLWMYETLFYNETYIIYMNLLKYSMSQYWHYFLMKSCYHTNRFIVMYFVYQ